MQMERQDERDRRGWGGKRGIRDERHKRAETMDEMWDKR